MIQLVLFLLIPFGLGVLVGLLERYSMLISSLFALILLVCFIGGWITSGFWSGVLMLLILGIPFAIGYNISSKKESKINYNGKRFTVSCPHCDCDKLDYLSEDGEQIHYKCPMCGKTCVIPYKLLDKAAK